MSKTVFFFVYGTLKEGGHFAKDFDDFRKSSTKATLSDYAMYNLGWFPTVKGNKGSVVYGELHEYTNPDIVTGAMDRIEGYSGNPDNSLFVRKKVMVLTDDAVEIEAFVYELSNDVPSDAEKIDAGVWGLVGVKA